MALYKRTLFRETYIEGTGGINQQRRFYEQGCLLRVYIKRPLGYSLNQ